MDWRLWNYCGRYMRGPQDLSFCDGVSESVDKLWMSAGASPSRLYSFNWLRMLRPFGTGRSFADRLHGPLEDRGAGDLRRCGSCRFSGIKAASIRRFACRARNVVSTELNADEMYRLMQEVGWREALRPSYQLSDFQSADGASRIKPAPWRSADDRRPSARRRPLRVPYLPGTARRACHGASNRSAPA